LNKQKGETPQRYPHPKDESGQVALKKENGEKESENAADGQKDHADDQPEF
jgi:hypothetical protein